MVGMKQMQNKGKTLAFVLLFVMLISTVQSFLLADAGDTVQNDSSGRDTALIAITVNSSELLGDISTVNTG